MDELMNHLARMCHPERFGPLPSGYKERRQAAIAGTQLVKEVTQGDTYEYRGTLTTQPAVLYRDGEAIEWVFICYDAETDEVSVYAKGSEA